MKSAKDDLAADAVFVIFDGESELLERLDDLERHGSDVEVHALAVEQARCVEVELLAVERKRERSVNDVQMRVETERPNKIDFAVAAISVEEIAVVEIAIRSGKSERLGQLMNGKVVPFGQHDVVPHKFLSRIFEY